MTSSISKILKLNPKDTMHILLGNTGRGGEQCIFSAFVKAYHDAYPDALIQVAICPEFLPLWINSKLIDSYITLDHSDPKARFYNDPIGRWHGYAESSDADLILFPCEYGLDEIHKNAPRPVVVNIYERLAVKPCPLEKIGRRVCFTPTDDEEWAAEDIFRRYGNDLLVMSTISNSAAPVMSQDEYALMAEALMKHVPVACTGRLAKPGPGGATTDPLVPGTIDLRGISFLTLYALSRKLKYWVGPDTGSSWMVANMPGRMVIVRGDQRFPVQNTGFVVNGFRDAANTLELEVGGLKTNEIIACCGDFLLPAG